MKKVKGENYSVSIKFKDGSIIRYEELNHEQSRSVFEKFFNKDDVYIAAVINKNPKESVL